MNIAQFAAANNLDANTLAHLMAFLQSKITATPELAEAFRQATPGQRDALISQGVRAWYEQSRALLTELRDNRTERAQALRAEMTEQVYVEARRRAGVQA